MALSWRDGPWVADTSAWARASHPDVAPQWKAAAHAGDLIGCPVVTLELLHDARNRDRVEAVATALAGLRQAPITRSVTDAAISSIRELAAQGAAGAHRVRVADALIAAAAAERGFAVLHCDQHFDRLATVLNFASQWVTEAGGTSHLKKN
ncbi:MAG TPA: PIN domain-containing protein [Solirubrobacteraceae bacterium]|nr:PIN domain-containing protein [Solirubrobacteraceae bacterium]